MKFCNLLAVVVACALSGCDIQAPGIKGSGNVVRAVRNVEAFDKLILSGQAEVAVLASEMASSCEVECDDNLLEHLSTEVKDGQLTIRFLKSVATTQKLSVHLTTEHLSKLSVAGSIAAKLEGLNETSLEIDVAGSGKLSCTGRVDKLSVSTSGSATFDCLELVADDVSIDIAGSGTANVQANRTLKIQIAGNGHVQYLGSPEIKKEILGIGSVKPAQSNLPIEKPVH